MHLVDARHFDLGVASAWDLSRCLERGQPPRKASRAAKREALRGSGEKKEMARGKAEVNRLGDGWEDFRERYVFGDFLISDFSDFCI